MRWLCPTLLLRGVGNAGTPLSGHSKLIGLIWKFHTLSFWSEAKVSTLFKFSSSVLFTPCPLLPLYTHILNSDRERWFSSLFGRGWASTHFNNQVTKSVITWGRCVSLRENSSLLKFCPVRFECFEIAWPVCRVLQWLCLLCYFLIFISNNRGNKLGLSAFHTRTNMNFPLIKKAWCSISLEERGDIDQPV